MPTSLMLVLVIYLCPDLEVIKPEYVVQGEQVTCMEYYTNDIINNPNKYKELVNHVKSRGLVQD